MNAKLIKACEKIMLEKVKHYRSDFYDYDVPRLKRMKEDERAILR